MADQIINIEQIKFYNENGFLIVNDVLSNLECDEYLNQIKKHANIDFAAIMNPDRFDFLIAQTFENLVVSLSLSERVDMVSKCENTSKMTFDIMSNKTSINILETLQKCKVVGLMSQMLFKEANSIYASQAWNPHQDNIYAQNNSKLSNGFTTQYLTTNFFLEDANIDNGSIYVYPGSHKFGLFDAENKISYREKGDSNPGNQISEAILSRFNKVDCVFKKGDLLILNGNCIHGSYPNNSNISRPLLSISYISEGETFIAGKNARRKVIQLG